MLFYPYCMEAVRVLLAETRVKPVFRFWVESVRGK
jgi:hypothetical protein